MFRIMIFSHIISLSTKLLHESKFKYIVCLFVTEVVQDLEGGGKIGGTERFKWGFLIKIHYKIKKNYI